MAKEVKFWKNFFENFFGLIFSVLFLFLLNRYYTRLPFLTDNFTLVLPIINISILINIAFHAMKLLITNRIFKQLTDLITTVISLFVIYQLYFFFPFSFTGDNILRIFFILMLVILSVVTIAQTISLLTKILNSRSIY
jgi:hypothetical protein